jgi:very-short-patch-repair endonuclease
LGQAQVQYRILGQKFSNGRRDQLVNKDLKAQKWKVLRFWEHEVERKSTTVAAKIAKAVMARRPAARN